MSDHLVHTWNADGQLLTVNGPRTDVTDLTTYAYYTDTTADHRRGDLMRVTNALGQVTNFTRYDGAGRLRESTDPNGVTTAYAYDARGRRTRKEATASAPQGAATVLYAYDPDDHLIAETDASGRIRSYVWRDDTPVAQIEHRPTRNRCGLPVPTSCFYFS